MGGTLEIVYIDGEKFTPNMAYWFRQMAAAFYRDTGHTLHPSSALRFGWEQEAIFRERYVPSWEVNGRRVYDWRWWQGIQWGRISAAGTVAVPGTSNHEFESTGYGAVDVYDSGADAGVSRRGSVRDKWMEQNARHYLFENEGYDFAEAWHKKFVGGLWDLPPDWASGGAVDFPTTREDEEMSGVLYGRNAANDPAARGDEWALAGTSPGTPANWLTIGDPALANAIAANTKSGNFIFLSSGYEGSTWDTWKAAYLAPLSTDEIEEVPPALPPKA